jgi:peptidoglycan/LPS O-acetylase OafA/YrhL
MSKLIDFRPDIEGFRGLAILVVVAFHCGVPGFAGGFIGVDVFFVLSGYLITRLLVAEVQENSRINLLNFYARRIRRLLPASALVLVVTLIAGLIVLAPNELAFAGRAARATAVYMSNVFFASNTADYFAPEVETNPMLHTWTLAVEEQFYLVWPLLIMLGLQMLKSRRALTALLFGLVILSLSASIWYTARGGVFAFYGLPTRAWEFGVGGLAALFPRDTFKSSGVWTGIGWLGVIAVVGSVYAISNPSNFPGYIALIPVLGTAAALVAGAERPGQGVNLLLERSPIQTLGQLSYSWYLWHWPFLIFAGLFLPNLSSIGKVVVCALSLGVAAAAHHFVENPIRFNAYLVRRPALCLYFGAAITLCSITVASLSIRFSSQLASTPVMNRIVSNVGDIADMSRDECLSPEVSSELKTCVFGDRSSNTNIVLFGDSHARQWFNPLRRIAESRNWKLTTMVKAACPATDVTPPELMTEALVANCMRWRAEAMRHIIDERPSVVFIGNATYYLARKNKNSSRSISLDEWREGTRRTLAALTAAGLNVVFMRDNPLPPFDVPMCLQRSARHTWYPSSSCEITKSTALNAAVFEAEKAGANGFRNIHFIDFTDHFCQGEVCPTSEGNTIIYRDDNHLTGKYAESLMPALALELGPILDGSN